MHQGAEPCVDARCVVGGMASVHVVRDSRLASVESSGLMCWSVVHGGELEEAVTLSCVVDGLVARLRVSSNLEMQVRSRCLGGFGAGKGTESQLFGAFSRVGRVYTTI